MKSECDFKITITVRGQVIAMNKYSGNIMAYLRQREGLDSNDTSMDEELNKLSPNEVFSEVLNWNGLISMDYAIKGWIKDIYGVDLDEVSK